MQDASMRTFAEVRVGLRSSRRGGELRGPSAHAARVAADPVCAGLISVPVVRPMAALTFAGFRSNKAYAAPVGGPASWWHRAA